MTTGGKVQLIRSTLSISAFLSFIGGTPAALSLLPEASGATGPDCLSDADHSVLSRPNWQPANGIHCQSANTWP